MFVRKTLGAVLATSLAGSVIAMTAGTASAAYAPDPDDSLTAPVAADLIGVGSDTSQHALKLLADAWNGGAKDDYAATFDVASFSALGSVDLPAPIATRDDGTAFTRPTGSGAGRAALYGTGRVSQVDFARSSGAPSQTDFNNGMRVIPFALDTVVPAVAGGNTHAAASLTLQQLRDIYVTCTMTTWADGTAIHPYVPKSGSGTEGFFKGKVVPSGQTYGACVKDHTDDANPDGSKVQEHDPALFTTDPLALVPFSKGRAALAGSAVKVVGGDEVAFKRNLYNVVRVEEMTAGSALATFFGSNGYVCSAAAHDLIKAAGFDQLATPAHGGDCGNVLNASSSNFALNEIVTTATTLTGTSSSAGQLTMTAKVTGSTTPVGKVTFTEGTKVLAADVPLVSGQATKALSGLTPGAHTIKAAYTPGDSAFLASSQTKSLTVKAPVVAKKASRLAETFPARVGHGRRATGRVQITIPSRGNGTVKLYDGKRLVKTVTVRAGNSPLITLPRLKVGRHAMKATWAGNAQYLASTLAFSIIQK